MDDSNFFQYPQLVNTEENRRLLLHEDKCDKYDYLAAVACGAIGGIIDIFLVGAPGDSVLGKWTDTQVDKAVMSFAKLSGWNPREAKQNNVASAIGFLEKKFKVNYDQRHSGDVNDLFNMSAKNHHMMSLGHSPDIIGLFFSILNQFTSTSTFISNGQLITINTETFELEGENFVSKIFCGVANWFGHIMSDVAGSSGARGNANRGSGVNMPFYELFQFCKVGKFIVGQDKQDLATIATRAFQEGYDLRYGLATTIPVIITDLSIRLIWALRRRFQYGKPLKECIPTSKHSDLRIMLLLGNGTLCIMDGVDAGVRSGGNALAFFMRLNLVAWYRFITLVLKEVCIRIGISNALEKDLEAYRRINQALLAYLSELEKIDVEAFRREVEVYKQLTEELELVHDDKELRSMLLSIYEKQNIDLPWEGNFDEYMSNKNAKLVFK